jgi:hypothetical protein
MERFFDYDPFTGVRTYFSSETGDDWTFTYKYDPVTYELDASRELAKDPDHWKDGVKDGWVHYAHIPDQVLHQWAIQGVNITDPKELLKMVNKPEFSDLKNTKKNHGDSKNRIIVAK